MNNGNNASHTSGRYGYPHNSLGSGPSAPAVPSAAPPPPPGSPLDRYAAIFSPAVANLAKYVKASQGASFSPDQFNAHLRNLIGSALGFICYAQQGGQVLSPRQLQFLGLNVSALHRVVGGKEELIEATLLQVAANDPHLRQRLQIIQQNFDFVDDEVTRFEHTLAAFLHHLPGGPENWCMTLAQQFGLPMNAANHLMGQIHTGVESGAFSDLLRDTLLHPMMQLLFPNDIIKSLEAAAGIPTHLSDVQQEEARAVLARISYLQHGQNALHALNAHSTRSGVSHSLASVGGSSPSEQSASGRLSPEGQARVAPFLAMNPALDPDNPAKKTLYSNKRTAVLKGLAGIDAEMKNGKKKYEVLAHLGDGGQGSVWKVKRLDLNREVAVKIQYTSQLTEREIKAMGQLSKSEGFTTVSDVTNYDGVDVIEMDLKYGPNVKLSSAVGTAAKSLGRADKASNFVEKYYEGPMDGMKFARLVYDFRLMCGDLFPEEEFTAIMAHVGQDMSDLMAEMWEAGLLHRDMKPENIMLKPKTIDILIELMNAVVPVAFDPVSKKPKSGAANKLKVFRLFRNAKKSMAEAGSPRLEIMDLGMVKDMDSIPDEVLVVDNAAQQNGDADKSLLGSTCGTLQYCDIPSLNNAPYYTPRDYRSVMQTFYVLVTGRNLEAAECDSPAHARSRQSKFAVSADEARVGLTRSLKQQKRGKISEAELQEAEADPSELNQLDEGVFYALIQSDPEFYSSLYRACPELAEVAYRATHITSWKKTRSEGSGKIVLVPKHKPPKLSFEEMSEAFGILASRTMSSRERKALISSVIALVVLLLGGGWYFGAGDTAEQVQTATETSDAERWLKEHEAELARLRALPTSTPEQLFAKFSGFRVLLGKCASAPASVAASGGSDRLGTLKTDAETEMKATLGLASSAFEARLARNLRYFDYVAGEFTSVDADLAKLREIKGIMDELKMTAESIALATRIGSLSRELSFCRRANTLYQRSVSVLVNGGAVEKGRLYSDYIIPFVKGEPFGNASPDTHQLTSLLSRATSLSDIRSFIDKYPNRDSILPPAELREIMTNPTLSSSRIYDSLHTETKTVLRGRRNIRILDRENSTPDGLRMRTRMLALISLESTSPSSSYSSITTNPGDPSKPYLSTAQDYILYRAGMIRFADYEEVTRHLRSPHARSYMSDLSEVRLLRTASERLLLRTPAFSTERSRNGTIVTEGEATVTMNLAHNWIVLKSAENRLMSREN